MNAFFERTEAIRRDFSVSSNSLVPFLFILKWDLYEIIQNVQVLLPCFFLIKKNPCDFIKRLFMFPSHRNECE